MKKNTKVYLAGKMDGLTKDEAMLWRLRAKDKLKYLYDIESNVPQYDYCEGFPNLMWDKDYYLLDKSDIILANFDYEKNSPFLGTSMEIGRAFNQGKPIIIFSKQKWVHESLTLQYHSSAIVNTMDEALEIINNFL